MGTASMGLGIRLCLGLLGLGSFAAGVLAVFTTENGAGAGLLVTFGGVLLVVALLGDRIESFEFGGAALRLRAEAANRFAQAQEAEARGEPAEADRLRREAQALMDAARPVADEYRAVRDTMPSGPERTMAMERVVAKARRTAQTEDLDPGEVARWLREGTDEERVFALGAMQGRPELADLDALLAALERPRSPFEHFHALLLIDQLLDSLDAGRRARVGDIVRRARGQWGFRRDSDRLSLGDQILRRLGEAD